MISRRAMVVVGAVMALTARMPASGSGGTGSEITLRIPSETAPGGGMVQMKVLTTEVTPISGGRPTLAYDTSTFSGVAGFGMFAPSGEIAGAALVIGNRVSISYTGTSTLTANYPILTIVLPIRSDAPNGTKTTFTIDPTSVWNYATTGPVTARISPAAVTIGGTISITDVIPGEGVWPAGTIVSVRGTGFSSKTSLRVNDAGVKSFRVVSPNEIQFPLGVDTNMRGLKITASGGNTITYYAYMRGIASTVSGFPLLAATEPIFSVNARTVATFGPIPAFGFGRYEGLALQNPNFVDAALTFTVLNPDGSTFYATTRTLETRHRLALELSELLDGVAPPAGATLSVTASAPVDVFALMCDEGTRTVSAALPLESRR